MFAKPVYSYTKFWQMVGRGTRLLETSKPKPWCLEKDVFLILDCWDNFEYFKLNPKGKELKAQLPLPVRLVGLRLDKIEKASDSGHAEIAAREIAKLRLQIAALPKESVVIKEAAAALARLDDDNFWISLSHERLEFLRAEIKPLFRTVSEADFKAMRFERDLLEYSLAVLNEDKEQSETIKEGSGATPTGGNEAYKSEGISLIRSMNVHDGKFVYKDLAFIDEVQANKLKNVVVEEHDVLLNITGASVCRCAIVPKAILPARVNQHVAIIRPKTGELNPKYLAAMFISNSYKTFLLKIARINGATREALTKDQLEKLGICKPPIELQNQFATIVEKTDAIKSSYQQSLTDLESLYGALSQKAFKGELDLSRVALPAAPIEGESPVAAGVAAPIATPVIELPETDSLLPAMHVLNET